MELLAQLPPASVDFVCCDPPFGITDAPWDKGLDWPAVWKELCRVCTPNAVVALFACGRFAFELYNSNPRKYRYKWLWLKPQGTDFLNARIKPLNNTEEILVFYMGKLNRTWYEPQKTMGHSAEVKRRKKPEPVSRLWAHRGGRPPMHRMDYVNTDGSRYPLQTLKFSTVPSNARLHNSQKPVPLLEHLIRSHCPPGGMVLDFAMGSGSTGVAAVQAGRCFTGMEPDDECFPTAERRIMQAWYEAGNNDCLEKDA